MILYHQISCYCHFIVKFQRIVHKQIMESDQIHTSY